VTQVSDDGETWREVDPPVAIPNPDEAPAQDVRPVAGGHLRYFVDAHGEGGGALADVILDLHVTLDRC
jgi:hypothetical protein